MTRRWVKEELKKNPVQDFFIKLIKYLKANRQNFLVGVAVFIILGLAGFFIIRTRVLENRYATQSFSEAQEAYSRFNYDRVIEKSNEIKEKYKNARIMDHVYYLKGMSYYEKQDFEKSAQVLFNASEKFSQSNIFDEILVSLASSYEQNQNFEEARDVYTQVSEDSYLKPEALAGEARIYELIDETDRAVEIYNRLQSRYQNTYWGETAAKRLYILGEVQEEVQEFQPDIQLR